MNTLKVDIPDVIEVAIAVGEGDAKKVETLKAKTNKVTPEDVLRGYLNSAYICLQRAHAGDKVLDGDVRDKCQKRLDKFVEGGIPGHITTKGDPVMTALKAYCRQVKYDWDNKTLQRVRDGDTQSKPEELALASALRTAEFKRLENERRAEEIAALAPAQV